MKIGIVFINCILLLVSPALFSQSLTFNKEGLNSVIQKIEESTPLTFNYNSESISAYTYTGTIDVNNVEKSMNDVLYSTPYTFEKSGNLILLIYSTESSYNICGHIKSSIMADLPYANVLFEKNNRGTLTNDIATFSFTAQGHKNDVITISHVGHISKSIMLQDWPKDKCLEVYLQEDTRLLATEVVIKDYLLIGITEGDEYGSLNIKYEELKHASTKEYDVLHTAQLLPGIHSIDESASNLHIRGATPDQNLVMWEGAPIYDPGHMFGMISSINPFVVKKMAVLKSVFHPKYDNRIGGIMDISLSDELSRKVSGGFGTTMTELHFHVDIPIIKEKMSLLIAGRNTINSFVKSPTLLSYSEKIFKNSPSSSTMNTDSLAQVFDNKIKFSDWNVKWMYQANEDISIKASYFKSSNYFEYESSLFEGTIIFHDEIFSDTEAISILSEIQWIKGYSRLQLISSSYNNESKNELNFDDEVEILNETSSSNNINDISMKLSHLIRTKKDNTLELGYTYNLKEVGFTYNDISRFELDIDNDDKTKGHFHNLFASYSFSKENVTVNFGLRSTYYVENKRVKATPRVRLQYNINPSLKFKLSAGRFIQYISQIQDFGQISSIIENKIWILNSSMDTEILTSDKFSGGIIYKNRGWMMDVEGYINNSSGLNGVSTSTLSEFTFGAEIESKTIGVDILIKKRWNKYQLWVNYTLSKNTYFLDEFAPISFPASNDRLHNLSLVQNWEIGNWNLSSTLSYRSGLPYSIPLGVEEFEVEGAQETYSNIIFGNFNNGRLKVYTRFDINISRNFNFSKRLSGEFSFSLLNVFNTQNIYSRTYQLAPIAGSGVPKIINIDKVLLGFTPQLLMRVKF
ncbi:MAG: TonB-dependent receptor plug domain-containing protein [Saprospiraceae bacterium]